MERIKRIKGGLFGVACGDALGATLEFTPKRKGEMLYGYHSEIIGGGVMKLKPGEVTDDTDMTIGVAEGILESPEDPIPYIWGRFVDWYKTGPQDVGNTVRAAMDFYFETGDYKGAALYAHEYLGGRSGGNGSLMRCIPPALYYRDFDKMIKVTREQSYLTHYDDEAAKACVIYNTMVYRYMNDEDKMKVVNESLKGTRYERIPMLTKNDLKPSGYVVDSFICALWCFINNDNFTDAVREAVNLYGDPDTIGAICGGIAGAYYGYDEIPERWKGKILVKDKLNEIAEKFDR